MPLISVPAAAAVNLIPRLIKLQKKAQKYGNADISFNVSDPYLVEAKDPMSGDLVETMMIDINVEGDAPVYEGGWSMLARIELLSEENLVHKVPGNEVEMNARFRTHGNMCEHCNKARNRNDVYVFEKDGKQVAVGRTCLRDFIGMDDPKAIVERAAFWEAVYASEKDEMTVFFQNNFQVKSVLEITAAFVRLNGFVSKAAATDGAESTASAVGFCLSGVYGYDVEVTDADREIAAATLAHFARAEMFGNDYMDNVRVICREGYVGRKNFGLICSAISTYLRSMAKEAVAAKSAATSEYMGETKARMRGVVAILEKSLFLGSSEFGDRYLMQFNAGGNVVIWFTTGNKEMTEGQEYTFDATVKEYKEFNGVKQTIVARLSVK